MLHLILKILDGFVNLCDSATNKAKNRRKLEIEFKFPINHLSYNII